MPVDPARWKALQAERRSTPPTRTVMDDWRDLLATLATLQADAHRASYQARRR